MEGNIGQYECVDVEQFTRDGVPYVRYIFAGNLKPELNKGLKAFAVQVEASEDSVSYRHKGTNLRVQVVSADETFTHLSIGNRDLEERDKTIKKLEEGLK